MRSLSLCLVLLSLAACGNGETNRIEGDGCQPACQTLNVDGHNDTALQLTCLDADLLPEACTSGGPICPGGGAPTCGEDGFPTCEGSEALPFCH